MADEKIRKPQGSDLIMWNRPEEQDAEGHILRERKPGEQTPAPEGSDLIMWNQPEEQDAEGHILRERKPGEQDVVLRGDDDVEGHTLRY